MPDDQQSASHFAALQVEGFRIGELTNLEADGGCEEGDRDGCRLAVISGKSQAVSSSNGWVSHSWWRSPIRITAPIKDHQIP